MRPPLLVLSLDGATFDLLRPLADAGDMPTLARLLASGAYAPLRSTVPPITPAAWASFLTGKQPGKHGIWDFRIYDPAGYRDALVSSRALVDRTFPQLLTAAGLRVAVVSLPLMYPPPQDAGTVVAGFDTPSVAATFTHPPDLVARLRGAIPDYRFVGTLATGSDAETEERFSELVAAVERSIAQRATVAHLLLDDGPWDVFLLHVQDTDALQHKVWADLIDPPRRPARRERLRRVYRDLDSALGSVVGRFPPETRVLVVSDHGFGIHHGRVYPNVLLRRWGVLTHAGRWRTRLLRSLRKRLGRPRSRAGTGTSWEVRVRQRAFAASLPVHWRSTRAYVGVAEIYGLLYLNLQGREPEGTVAPGAEAERLLADLEHRFRTVTDPVDGTAVFTDVLRGTTLAPEDRHGRRPDLVLVPRADLTVGRELNDRLWLERYQAPMGTHRPDGVFVLSGAGVASGPLSASVHLVDLAPTILAMAGVPIPHDVDGRVLQECFTTPLAVHRQDDSVRPSMPEMPSLSPEDEASVAERLRALGYLA